MDIRIYTMTHKKYKRPNYLDPDIYIDLQVGSALGDNIGYIGDDMGDSISEKNRTFCELTGLYWVWKNISCDVAGLAHYRRFFISEDGRTVIGRKEIEGLLSTHDMIISLSSRYGDGSVYDNYNKWHKIQDLDMCRNVMEKLYPDDVAAFDLAMNCSLLSGGNMLIAPKKIFDEYCSWLFSILFDVEKCIDISGYDVYQRRVFGFLSERLMRVFVMSRHYRIKEMPVGQVDY